MKKISQINWNRYKQSEAGKEAIALFEKANSPEFSHQDMLDLAMKYNPQFFKNFSPKEQQFCLEMFKFYDSFLDNMNVGDIVENFESTDDFCNFYLSLLTLLAQPGDIEELLALDEIPAKNFKELLPDNIILSFMLYAYMPEFFIPNFFPMQFLYLKKFAEKYDIELPEVPNRSDYLGRNRFYADLCLIFFDFAQQNNLSTEELCAFIYDYEFPVLKEELENEDTSEMPLNPGQAWILVGNYGEGEKTMDYGFWQANEFTEKGDLLLFYEKSPVKKLNSIWIAQQDGVVDPFFFYYSNTYIGQKISIPDEQAIRFEDFKNSVYFQQRDKKGNFVSKNFQDVSGWRVTFDDYEEIKRMLAEKGFDTSVLPALYQPKVLGNHVITVEDDVSNYLLIPLLEQMGWEKGKDFKAEVEFNAGRTKTNHSSDKRPDFCLHIVEKNDDIEAKVAIEVKKHMKNRKEIHKCFTQGRSYAKWGNVRVLLICDQERILVYERDRNNSFNENKPIEFKWHDMENPDKYSQLKQLLS